MIRAVTLIPELEIVGDAGPVPAEAVELVAELLLDAVDSKGKRLADAADDGEDAAEEDGGRPGGIVN